MTDEFEKREFMLDDEETEGGAPTDEELEDEDDGDDEGLDLGGDEEESF
jgi:hypothetical protein